jgi:hypothetical protein
MLRNCLLILLVALLPIRSFASESMGLSMPQSGHSMQMMTEADASHCEMMGSSSPSSNSQSEHHDKPVCQACSLCMAFAFTVPYTTMNMNFYSHQLTVREVLLIDSASLALPLKPPIL